MAAGMIPSINGTTSEQLADSVRPDRSEDSLGPKLQEDQMFPEIQGCPRTEPKEI